jgi:REP element-mobilizing transposase RayT
MDSSTSQTILENLYSQIGDTGLIIHAKAMNYFSGSKLSQNEIERLLILFSSNDLIFSNEMAKIKLWSVLLYLQAEYDADKAAVFSAKIEQWQNANRNLLRSSISLDHLHIVFNIIEFEDKFRMMNSEKMKLVSLQLSTFEKLEKPFEEFILFKYYMGILKHHQKDYHGAKMASMEIVVEIGDEIQNKNDKSSLLEYIELKNQILNFKIDEKDLNDKEIMANLLSLLETHASQSPDLAIQLGFKASDIYFNNYDYEKAGTILLMVFKKIKSGLIYSYSNFSQIVKKSQDLIEIYLNTLSRIIFCYILTGKNEESLKFLKKMEKFLNLIRDNENTISRNSTNINNNNNIPSNNINKSLSTELKEKETRENILAKFHFYSLIFKYILKPNSNHELKAELNTSINNYRLKFKNQMSYEDDVIINIYSLNSSDVLSRNFFDKVNTHMSIITNNKLLPVRYISLFFALFNQISILTKNIATDSNLKKQFEYIEKIRNCSKAVVEYVNKYIDNNTDLRLIFSYNYFKEVLIKIYISYVFTFYFTKEYKKALEVVNEFENLKSKLGLADGNMIKHYVGVIKIKGDILFKMEDFIQAANCYANVIHIYEETLNHASNMALVMFNLGVCYVYNKEYQLAKKSLMQSKTKFDLLNSINQGNSYEDKVKQIGNLLNALSPMLNSD